MGSKDSSRVQDRHLTEFHSIIEKTIYNGYYNQQLLINNSLNGNTKIKILNVIQVSS